MRQIQLTLEQKDRLVLSLSLAVIMLIAFLWYVQNRTPDIVNYPTENTKVIAFGDSLIAGVGSSDNKGFITQLEPLINRDIEQFGFSGYTSTQGLEIVDEVVEEDAGIVIISLGGNDRIQRVDQERVHRNMSKIISKFQNNGSIVVLLEIPGYGSMYRDLGQEHKAVVINRALASLITNPNFMSDLIHPNDAGYAKMAERIAKQVRKVQ